MKKRIPVLLSVLLLLFSSAVFAERKTEIYPVGMAGFGNRVHITNLSDEAVQAFPSINEYLMNYLFDCERLSLVDLSEEADQARINEIVFQLDMGKPVKEFSHSGTKFLIFGYLTNLSLKTSGAELNLPAYGLDTRSHTVCANISVKIVKTDTGELVYVATGEGKSTSAGVDARYGRHTLKLGNKAFTDQSLHNALQKAAAQAADKLIKAI